MSIMLEIRGLPEAFDEDDVHSLCDDFGTVHAVHLFPPHENRRAASVEFSEEWNAELAMSELDGMRVDGCYLQVDLASHDAIRAHRRAG